MITIIVYKLMSLIINDYTDLGFTILDNDHL